MADPLAEERGEGEALMQLIDDILITGSSVPAAPPARPLEHVPTCVLIAELERRYASLVIGTVDPAGQIGTYLACQSISHSVLLGQLVSARSLEEVLGRRSQS